MSSPPEPTTLILAPRVGKRRSQLQPRLASALVLLLVLAGAGAWAMGVRPAQLWKAKEITYRTVAVAQGEIRVYVVESGNLESADNAMVKCQVEAILGTVAGGVNGMGGAAGGGGGVSGGRGGMGNLAGAGINAGVSQAAPAAAKGAVGATAKGAAAGATAKGAAGGATAKGGGGGGAVKPQIQSFTMQVIPHTPLRPRAITNTAATKGRAGGMGGGGGGRGGGMQDMGQQGSTKIIMLVPEGSTVKAGEIVCELDAAPFRDELQAQKIRWEQAKSWVDQAREILKVGKIALQEYREGIYPQDFQQIDKYIEICRTQLKRAQDDLEWSKIVTGKKMQSQSQLRAAEYGEEQYRIVLQEAEGMKRRLINFTAPRLIKNLEAKISSVEADLLAQESSFQLEDDRRRKLQKMIDLCILRAPRDGLVAYALSSSGPGWNPTATPMQEGVTVRQGQTILQLPDSTKMRVKVRVNESKISQVYPGQKVAIRVEAFPDQPLTGQVREVTAIPAPANGPISDVKLYYAIVEIDQGGFAGLRTGLSAEVAFFVDRKHDVTKVPVAAVRWVDGETFAAVPRPDGKGFDWRSIELGLIGTREAEVVKGLKPGDRVIAQPDALTAPKPVRGRIGGAFAAAKGAPDAGS